VGDFADAVHSIATERPFSGVVRLDRDGEGEFANAYGLANRAYGIANTVDTQFGIASGGKFFTALAVMSLVEEGRVALDTPVRKWLGEDLPLIGAGVTVELLLAHRSGIGDYLDEESVASRTDYLMAVPVQELATTEEYLAVLDGHPMKFAPGERFAYCNGGYVVLALVAERASGVPFADLIAERVCAPADLRSTAFLRSDELPAGAAIGYLHDDRDRTNVFHLPVRGSGDGGIYSTADDVHRLWSAFVDGRVVSSDSVAEMVRPRSTMPSGSARYGLGVWLHRATDVVMLEGCDAGVSFRSACDPARNLTVTVLSNTTDGAWMFNSAVEAVLDAG
jgi:CubicO group peptidase (beta-lactamase class C family)